MENLIFVILIGIGATAMMDLWSFLRKLMFNITPTDWKMVGRWIAHMKHGKFHHLAIAESSSIRGERLIGWALHYLIGISFAALLIIFFDNKWLQNPTIGPALTIGVATVVAPFFILQPAMGAGIAASRTIKPNLVRLHSIINHAVFGFGLFLSAIAIKLINSI